MPIVKKPEPPIVDNGLQIETEIYNFGSSVAASYKLNPHLSFGVGYGYAIFSDKGYNEGSFGGIFYQDNSDVGDIEGCLLTRLFLTGQYRLLNKRVSPIIGANGGFQTVHHNDISATYVWYCKEDDKWGTSYSSEASDYYRKRSLFFSPFFGVSCRLRGNNYLSLKMSYVFADKLNPKNDTFSYENRYSYYDYHYENCHFEEKLKVGGNTMVMINYTHTFNFGQGLHEKAMEKARKLMNRESN